MKWLLLAVAVLVPLGVSLYTARRMGNSSDSLLGHFAELRRRILLSMMSVVALSIFVFSFRIVERGGWPVPWPSVHDNLSAQVFAFITQQLVPANVTLVVVRPLDGFTAQLLLSLGIGALLSMPVLLHHAVAFLGPALKPTEQRALLMAMVPASLLFLGGVLFCWTWVLPFVLETLYGYGAALGAQPLLQVSDLVSFTVMLLLVFGIAFQTPLVMVTLTRAGITSAKSYLRHWRGAVVTIVIVSALVTDPSVVSQLLVAGPLVMLYFLGVGLSFWAQSRRNETD